MPGARSNQFESTVSSFLQRGGYRNVDQSKRDILTALAQYPGLRPKYERFVFNDGRGKEFICLDGTIPVHYRGSSYNIPVCIWILDTHPLHAPLCYVKPTPLMQIKTSPTVDQQGKVYLPYLHEWGSGSDLFSLIQMCIIAFSESPPVFAKPQGPQRPPPPAPTQSPPYPPGPTPYPPSQNNPMYPPYPVAGSASGYPPYPPTGQGQADLYPPPYSTVCQGTEAGSNPLNNGSTITQEHIRLSLQTAVEDKVRRALQDDYNTKQVEIHSLQKIQDELNAGQRDLRAKLEKLDAETGRMGNVCDALKQEKDNLKLALDKLNRDEEDGEEESGPDRKIVTVTPLFNQILTAYGEELALSDAIYYLSEGLRKGIIDCDSFLKQVRDLSRKQFFLRATMRKAREKAGLPA